MASILAKYIGKFLIKVATLWANSGIIKTTKVEKKPIKRNKVKNMDKGLRARLIKELLEDFINPKTFSSKDFIGMFITKAIPTAYIKGFNMSSMFLNKLNTMGKLSKIYPNSIEYVTIKIELLNLGSLKFNLNPPLYIK